MTREDAKKILGENATDEQITSLLNSVHTELQEKDNTILDLQTKLTNSSNKVNELTGYEEELRKIKESQMTEQEKIAQKEKELASKISDTSKLANSIKAKSILIGAGISNERADILVKKFVKEDEAETLELAQEFVNEFNSIKETTTKKVTEELSNIDVTPNGSNVNPKTDKIMTWDKFCSMSSDEQNKFQEEHPDEFENL